jgi:prepilin-type N-terminal cleavage/methylation domain-containing protein
MIKCQKHPSQGLHNQGFTLVELMVALALSVFLLGGLLLTYSSGRTASLEAERLSRLQENIRFASDYLVRDIRNAGFRDLLTLTFQQDLIIGQGFAEYGEDGDQSELIIRYAGRGACGRVFEADVLKVVENRYFVAENGDLVCQGSEIADDGSLTTSEPVTLAAGLQSANFQLLFAVDEPNLDVCDYYDPDGLDSACTGVRVDLTFEDDPPRQLQLVAAFRNVIIDRLYGR